MKGNDTIARVSRALCAAVAFGCISSVAAQERPPSETVTSRERPETDPLGARLGVWTLDASASLGYQHDDNIFAADTGEEDDDILVLRPRAMLASDWGRHAVRLGAEGTLARYSDFDDEDYDDSRFFAEGRLDLPRGNVAATVSRSDLHEARTSPDDLRGLEPTTFSISAADLAWTFRPGALLVRPDIRYRSFSFDDTPTALPGDPVQCRDAGSVAMCSNADRDRDTVDAGVRIGYELRPEYDLFLEGRASVVDYDMQRDFDGFERSSDGYELLAGSTFDFGSTTFGEVYAGYRHWSYDDDRFDTITGPAFGADVAWNASGLTTLRLEAHRTIESTTIVGASGVNRTAFALSADHELLRNLLLWARVATATEDFDGIDRDDDLTEFGLGARYFMNRHLYVALRFDQEKRDGSGANASGQEYDINKVELMLQGNL